MNLILYEKNIEPYTVELVINDLSVTISSAREYEIPELAKFAARTAASNYVFVMLSGLTEEELLKIYTEDLEKNVKNNTIFTARVTATGRIFGTLGLMDTYNNPELFDSHGRSIIKYSIWGNSPPIQKLNKYMQEKVHCFIPKPRGYNEVFFAYFGLLDLEFQKSRIGAILPPFIIANHPIISQAIVYMETASTSAARYAGSINFRDLRESIRIEHLEKYIGPEGDELKKEIDNSLKKLNLKKESFHSIYFKLRVGAKPRL